MFSDQPASLILLGRQQDLAPILNRAKGLRLSLIFTLFFLWAGGTLQGFPGGSDSLRNLPAMQETRVQSLGWEDPLEEGMANHPVFSPGESPWTEEPGGLQPTDTTEQLSTY